MAKKIYFKQIKVPKSAKQFKKGALGEMVQGSVNSTERINSGMEGVNTFLNDPRIKRIIGG